MPVLVAALAAAGALVAASAQASPAVGEGDVRIEAERMVCDAESGRCLLEGRVLLRRGEVSLRADRATWTPETGEVEAAGNVLLVDRARVVSARAVRAVLGGAYRAEEVVAWLKDGPVRLEDAEEAGGGGAGRTRLRLSGRELHGETDGRYVLEGARVTVCDCPGGAAPTWELRTRRVEVVPGAHADLQWPVLWVTPRFLRVDRPVPILAFPWLRLPVSERQSGLLLPTFGSAGASGSTVTQPLFLTLGRSADATVAASWSFGESARGPGASLELRWAPAAGSEGELELSWLQDSVDETDAETVGLSGARVSLRAEHAQRLSARARLRVDLGLFSDPLQVRDLAADRLGRDASTRRSAVLLSARGDEVEADLEAGYYLALAPDGSLGLAAQRALVDRYGPFGADLPVFHRWPSASATLLPVPLAGPLRLSGRIGVARFAPLSGYTSDSGRDGLGPGDRGWIPGDGPAAPPVPCELDGAWNCGERLAVTRADARAELVLPLLVGGAVAVEPYLRGAVLGYLYDAALDPEARAWAVGGAVVSTEISRRFGPLRHAIRPLVEWRIGSAVAGPAPSVPAYDAWDRLRIEPSVSLAVPPDPPVPLPPRRVMRAAPEGAFQQLALALETRLTSPAQEILRLAIGQDLDLSAGRPGETWFALRSSVRPFALDVRARLDPFGERDGPSPAASAVPSWLDGFTSLRATGSLADRRGDRISLGLVALGPGASGDLVAGVDALFDPQPAPAEGIAQGRLATSLVLGPATLGWEAQFPGRPLDVPACPGEGGGDRRIGSVHVQQHVFRFGWDSPCRCLRLRAAVTVDDCGRVGFSGGLDLGAGAVSSR